MKRFYSSVVGLAFLVAGAAALLQGGFALEEALRSSHWPSVPGRVVSSKVVAVSCLEGGGGNCTAPDIRYRYAVRGIELEGTRLGVLAWETNGSAAKDAVAAFPEGREVTVYYDPTIPSRSVLRTGPGWAEILMIAVAAGMVLGGLYVLKPESPQPGSRLPESSG